MIKIELQGKEKLLLELVYLNHFCRSSGSTEYKDLEKIKDLKKKTSAELLAIMDKMRCEKLANKYMQIQDEGQYSDIYFSEYGYPFGEGKVMNSQQIKKLLLLDLTKIEQKPSSDLDILEIQFFYCLFQIRLIIQTNAQKGKKQYLDSLREWGNYAIPIFNDFFKKKKTKTGFYHKVEFFIDVKRLEEELSKDETNYIELFYRAKRNFFEQISSYMSSFFDYKYYLSDIKIKYLIAYLVGVDVCPYCNRQYISVLPENEKTTFTLDHYKREENFPMLKISLYNLVPSCYTCNSILKNTNSAVHLNPWFDDDGGIRFTYEKESGSGTLLKDYYQRNNCENIQETVIEIDDSQCTEKARNSIDTFYLKDIYQAHNHHVSELIAKAIKYEICDYKKAIYKILYDNKLLSKEDQLDFYLYGSVIKKKDIYKVAKSKPLYKLETDIINEIRASKL